MLNAPRINSCPRKAVGMAPDTLLPNPARSFRSVHTHFPQLSNSCAGLDGVATERLGATGTRDTGGSKIPRTHAARCPEPVPQGPRPADALRPPCHGPRT